MERSAQIFNLILVQRNGRDIEVTSKISIESTPQGNICTNLGSLLTCCDNTLLGPNQVYIPESDFIFGVVTNIGSIQLETFSQHVPEYNVEQLQLSLGPNEPVPGVNYTLTENALVDRPLLLLRFILGMDHQPYWGGWGAGEGSLCKKYIYINK